MNKLYILQTGPTEYALFLPNEVLSKFHLDSGLILEIGKEYLSRSWGYEYTEQLAEYFNFKYIKNYRYAYLEATEQEIKWLPAVIKSAYRSKSCPEGQFIGIRLVSEVEI